MRQAMASAVLDDGCIGYSDPSLATQIAVATKLDTTHGFDGRVADNLGAIRWLPGLIPALHHIIRVAAARYTEAQPMSIATVAPIYARFLATGRIENTAVHEVPLRCETVGTHELRYALDTVALEEALSHAHCKVLLWCNPHNPTGRVWTRDELLSVARLCVKHDVLLLSDEVWSDVLYDPTATPFIGMAGLLDDVPGLLERLVVITAPSKTFNIATANVAFAAVLCPTLRRQLIAVSRDKAETPPLGYAAVLSAYADPKCAAWRARLIAYLQANRDHAFDVLSRNVEPTHLKLTRPEATYLMWMHVGGFSPEAEVMRSTFFARHGVALTSGSQCGDPLGERINFATPRVTLDHGLDRILRAFDELQEGPPLR